jgi:WD40 repeat protein
LSLLPSSVTLNTHTFGALARPSECASLFALGRSDRLELRQPILALSVLNGYAALGLQDGSVCMCSLSPLRVLFDFEAHPGYPASAVHLVSPSQLLTGGGDGTVCLWRLDEDGDSDRRRATFEGHQGPVVCLYGDGEKVVSGARDGTVRVWEAETAKVRFELRGFTAYLGSLRVSPQWLIADGTNNAVLKLYFTEEAILAQADEDDDED